MGRVVVDTGVLIAAERGRGRVPDDDEVAIAAITAAELLLGVELADDRHRSGRAAAVETLLRSFEILEFDLTAARHHARLVAHARSTGSPRGAHDLIIAATASATGHTVLTTDASGFSELPGVAWRLLAPR